MTSVLDSRVIDRGFEGLFVFAVFPLYTVHAILRNMTKDWLSRNQDNMSCLRGTTCLSKKCYLLS